MAPRVAAGTYPPPRQFHDRLDREPDRAGERAEEETAKRAGQP